MPSQRATVYLTPETMRILGDSDSLSGLINGMAERHQELISALETASKIIRGMSSGPACFKPSQEALDQINRALHNAKS